MFFSLCAPQPINPDELIQDSVLDEHVSADMSAGPTLMQSKAWVESHSVLKARTWCRGAAADRSSETSFGLDALRRMAEQEEAAKQLAQEEAAKRLAEEEAAASREIVDISEGTLRTSLSIEPERWHALESVGADEVRIDNASARQMVELSTFRELERQLDLERQQAEELEDQMAKMDHTETMDELESPSNPPSSGRVALLREAEDREAERVNRLEREAIQRSTSAREEREMREKVRAFLAAHGYRHVRARCSNTTMSKTYPLHCAVWCNDVDMVGLLLCSRADPTQANGWGQTPLQYAQRRNSRQGSHSAVLEVLNSNSVAFKEA